jgi:hypothetical protein
MIGRIAIAGCLFVGVENIVYFASSHGRVNLLAAIGCFVAAFAALAVRSLARRYGAPLL